MKPLSELNMSEVNILSQKYCDFLESWKQPLYNPYANALNPCFLSLVFVGFNGLFAFFILKQIIDITIFNSFGPYKIKYSFGSVFNIKVLEFSLYLN